MAQWAPAHSQRRWPSCGRSHGNLLPRASIGGGSPHSVPASSKPCVHRAQQCSSPVVLCPCSSHVPFAIPAAAKQKKGRQQQDTSLCTALQPPRAGCQALCPSRDASPCISRVDAWESPLQLNRPPQVVQPLPQGQGGPPARLAVAAPVVRGAQPARLGLRHQPHRAVARAGAAGLHERRRLAHRAQRGHLLSR